MVSRLLRVVVLPLLLIAVGVFFASRAMKSPPRAQRTPPDAQAPIVDLAPLLARPERAMISGSGIVTPAQELNLMPQVAGSVTYVSPRLVPGARVKRGEVLVRVDQREYELAVEQQRGSVRSAELAIEEEEARKDLATQEWAALGESGQATALFSRESQLAAARANLASGASALERARLELDRATLRAPFDGAVVRKSVAPGQVVSPGSALGYIVGVEEIWVVVSVRLDDLALLSIPGVGKDEKPPSRARVVQRLAHGGEIVREGHVARLVEQLDAQTRRAQVVVEIEDALSTERGLPLLPGAMVVVELEGRPFEQVFAIPRTAVYDGETVWVFEGGKLAPRTLEIGWGDREHLYATGGVEQGDQLVVSRLASPLVGAAVRARSEIGSPPADAPAPAEAPAPSREVEGEEGGEGSKPTGRIGPTGAAAREASAKAEGG